MKHFDVIVLGLGGIGSALLHRLSKQPLKVLGIDQFSPPHDRGSSHGETRLFRQAYFEDIRYLPLLKGSEFLWKELEADSGKKILHQVGCLQVGAPDSKLIVGAEKAAGQAEVLLDRLEPGDLKKSFPAFRAPEGASLLFEKNAGFLEVETAIQTAIEVAQRNERVETRLDERVETWQAQRRGVFIKTNRSQYAARKLVITAGPWAVEILKEVRMKLSLLRKAMFWYEDADRSYSSGPTFLCEGSEGKIFYGFPDWRGTGVKLAQHGGGTPVERPEEVCSEVLPGEKAELDGFISAIFPDLGTTVAAHSARLVTMTPDQHFVVDYHPRFPFVSFVAGMSGQGFQFAPAIAENLAQRLMGHGDPYSMDFLNCRRASLYAG